MTAATLSFASSDRVALRCDDVGINEHRDLDADPPFDGWSQAYATGTWSAEALLGIGLAIGRWFDLAAAASEGVFVAEAVGRGAQRSGSGTLVPANRSRLWAARDAALLHFPASTR